MSTPPVEPETRPRTGLSIGRGIVMVAGGILAAIAVLWVIAWLRTPSDADCAIQRADVLLGERETVDPACVGR